MVHESSKSGAREIHEITYWCTSMSGVRDWCMSKSGALDGCTRVRSGARDYGVVHESLTNMYNGSSGEGSSLVNIQYVQ